MAKNLLAGILSFIIIRSDNKGRTTVGYDCNDDKSTANINFNVIDNRHLFWRHYIVNSQFRPLFDK